MASPPPVLLLDLGNVLFFWTAKHLTALPRKTFHRVVTSKEWEALERGEVGEEEAVQRIAASFSLDARAITAALEQCRPTLSVDKNLLAKLVDLKDRMGGHVKVYAMTNVTKGDFVRMKTALPDWSLFDKVYTSFEAGCRKPEERFYRQVIEDIGVDAKDVVFVDDTSANIDAAATLGICALLFKFAPSLVCHLNYIFPHPQVVRGKAWLQQNARRLTCEMENGPAFPDAFSQFLIMDFTRDPSLLRLHKDCDEEANLSVVASMSTARVWNYFIEEPIGTSKIFPDDVDTTSWALIAFDATPESAKVVLDQMLAIRTLDTKIVQTYWDPTRPRTDVCVLTNVVRAFYKYGKGADIQESLSYIRKGLVNGDHLLGTRHYYSPETFLFFMSQLIAANPHAPEVQALREPLAQALKDRVGVYENTEDGRAVKVDPLAIAMRVLAAQALGLPTQKEDIERLKSYQDKDGGWQIGWVCRFGKTKLRIGSRGVTTAFAIKALDTDAKTIAVDDTCLDDTADSPHVLPGVVAGEVDGVNSALGKRKRALSSPDPASLCVLRTQPH